MMVVDLSLLFFVLLGSKLVMGGVAIYMLLPDDASCAICDAETLPLEHPRSARGVMRLLRLQRRWCIECRRESIGRRRAPSDLPAARTSRPVAERRVR
jgi:hypothetical protein